MAQTLQWSQASVCTSVFLMYNKLNEQQDARPKNSDNGDSEIFICFLLLFFFSLRSCFFSSLQPRVQYGIYFRLAPKEIECLFYLNSNNTRLLSFFTLFLLIEVKHKQCEGKNAFLNDLVGGDDCAST